MDRDTTAGELTATARMGGMDRPIAGAKTALRWAALAVVTFISAEIFARLDDVITWKAPLLQPYRNELLLMGDSGGMRGRPGYRYQKWGMNSAGFRGPELKGTARERIVILGASETFGLFEAEGQEYPARLQTFLDSVAPARYEVINAALPGMGLPSMDYYYRNSVAPLGPRLVLVYPSPSFYLELSPPADGPIWSLPRKGSEVEPFGQGFFESRILTKARDVIKQVIPSILLTWSRDWRLSRLRAGRPTGWTWQAPPEERLELFRHDLERVIEGIQVSGAMPVLITHTNRFIGLTEAESRRERRHLVNLIARYYPRASEAVLTKVDSAANRVIREVVRQYGARVIEAEGRIPNGDQYFADYAHFTNQGADVMAHLIARAVLQGWQH